MSSSRPRPRSFRCISSDDELGREPFQDGSSRPIITGVLKIARKDIEVCHCDMMAYAEEIEFESKMTEFSRLKHLTETLGHRFTHIRVKRFYII